MVMMALSALSLTHLPLALSPPAGDMYLARFEVRKVPDELLSEGSGAAGVMSSNMAAGPVDTMDVQPSSPSQAAAHTQQQEQQQPVAELQQKWQYLALGY
jgi:hypothetical protein